MEKAAVNELNIIDTYNEINKYFESEFLDEYDFIPTIEPPFVIHAEQKLGISAVVVKTLYRYVEIKFREFNSNRYNRSVSMISDAEEAIDLIRVTRGILLVKGDNPIAFNRRKELIIAGYIACMKEIDFLNVLFTRHPKSPSAWQHRRFCLMQRYGSSVPKEILASELLACSKFSENNPKNYYSWMHRLYLQRFLTINEVLWTI